MNELKEIYTEKTFEEIKHINELVKNIGVPENYQKFLNTQNGEIF